MDSVDSTYSLNFKQSENTCQTLDALTNSNESVVVNENKYAEMQVGTSSAILEQPEENHKHTLSSDVNRDKGDCQQGGFDGPTRHSSRSFLKQSHRSSLTEASQHQRDMHRRCLQFEESQQETLVKSTSSWKITNLAASSSSACSLLDSDVLKPPHVEILAAGGSTQLANVTQSASPMFSSRDNRNLSTTVSRPAGIGLHLNSIAASMPLDSAVISGVQSANKGNSSLIGRNALSVMRDRVSDNTRNCFNSSNVTVNVLASIEDSRDENNSSATVSSISSLSLHNVKPLNTCLLLKPTEHRLVSCDMEKINFELDGDKEHNQSSTGKKRKKTSSISSSVDCKRCNCKKTKCLKLYCDCFASGIYCAEPCSCQGCFNRPDYEDTVSETRQLIESRNPLAFAPKIIQRATRALATSNWDINQSTPFSARHQRGCKCKKSMCLKKYCECYQASVGCSSGCRCEGCKNTYGRKEEHSLNKDVVSNRDIDGRAEGLFDEKLDLLLVKDDLLHTDTYNTQNFTPLTESVQCSEKNALTRFLPGRYLLSPKSNPTFLATYERSLETPRNFNNQDMVAENHKDVLGFVSFEDLNFGNTEAVDQFSTRYHGNTSNLTTLPHSSSTMASLMSPKKTTPTSHFERNKLVDVLVSNSRLDDVVEDETPDILKYDSTPHNTVKASSPNKKRISPPHGHLSELGSSSSAGLRTGRKFILKAVPFPPLTQCIDLKSSNSQNRNDPEDHCNAND